MARLTSIAIAVTEPAVTCKGGLPGTDDCVPPPILAPPPKIIVAMFPCYAVNVNVCGVAGLAAV